jgi:hypothetical protein
LRSDADGTNSRECAYRVREKERENLFSVNLIERMIERKFSSAHRVCYSGNRVEWKGEKNKTSAEKTGGDVPDSDKKITSAMYKKKHKGKKGEINNR